MQEQIPKDPSIAALLEEREELLHRLEEASDTIEAIRTGQVDALVMHNDNVHRLYTLRTADQTYRLFIEKMSEGAVTLTHSGMILFCNSQFATMTGTDLSLIAGSNLEDYLAEGDRPLLRSILTKSTQEEAKQEVQLVKNGILIPVLLSCSTLEMEEGINISIIITDLTLQKEIQEQLQQNNTDLARANKALEASNRDLQQFASVASHDLQEPLRKIQVFSNMLLEQNENLTGDAEKYLQKILESGARMRTLIIDILNYSRLSAGNTEAEEISLNGVVTEILDDLELLISEKKAGIHVGELPVIYGNKGQIRQVFHNILGNSLKFSKKEVAPEINITSKRIKSKSFDAVQDISGDYYLVSIEDNGIGFDEIYLDNVFALFERLNPKDQYEGTGIGMAITKKIIEKHDGLINAESKKGEGARFNLILPIKKAN